MNQTSESRVFFLPTVFDSGTGVCGSAMSNLFRAYGLRYKSLALVAPLLRRAGACRAGSVRHRSLPLVAIPSPGNHHTELASEISRGSKDSAASIVNTT